MNETTNNPTNQTEKKGKGKEYLEILEQAQALQDRLCDLAYNDTLKEQHVFGLGYNTMFDVIHDLKDMKEYEI